MTDVIDDSEHPCYRCLVKACCHNWCSGFFRWLAEYQEVHGTIKDDIMVNYIVKKSRNESWSEKN